VDDPPLVDTNGDAVPDQVTLCSQSGDVRCSTDLIVALRVPTDAPSIATGNVVVSLGLVRDASPTVQTSRLTTVHATSTQLVTVTNQVTILAYLTIVIAGGQSIDFGPVTPDGSTQPVPGVTAVPVAGGYQYTYRNAVVVMISGTFGPWTASCYVSSTDGIMSTLALSTDGQTFTPVGTMPPGSACLSGWGPRILTLDLRITVTWNDAPGSVAGQLIFAIADGGSS
jgi:hypothetical protein